MLQSKAFTSLFTSLNGFNILSFKHSLSILFSIVEGIDLFEAKQRKIVRTVCYYIIKNMEKDPVKTTAAVNEKPIISFKPYKPFKEVVAHLFLIFDHEHVELSNFSPIAWMFFFHKVLTEEPRLFKRPRNFIIHFIYMYQGSASKTKKIAKSQENG